jgi:hypothetical protein
MRMRWASSKTLIKWDKTMKLMSIILSFAILLTGCYSKTTVTKDRPNTDNEELTFRLRWITYNNIKVFYNNDNWSYIISKGGQHHRIDNGYEVTGKLVNSKDNSSKEFSGVLNDEQIKEVTISEYDATLTWVARVGAILGGAYVVWMIVVLAGGYTPQ